MSTSPGSFQVVWGSSQGTKAKGFRHHAPWSIQLRLSPGASSGNQAVPPLLTPGAITKQGPGTEPHTFSASSTASWSLAAPPLHTPASSGHPWGAPSAFSRLVEGAYKQNPV